MYRQIILFKTLSQDSKSGVTKYILLEGKFESNKVKNHLYKGKEHRLWN